MYIGNISIFNLTDSFKEGFILYKLKFLYLYRFSSILSWV